MASKKIKIKSADQEAIERYLKEITFWEQKEQEAIEKENYSDRDWARSQLFVKRTNCKILAAKIGAGDLRKWNIVINF